jgi:hypothetical protein
MPLQTVTNSRKGDAIFGTGYGTVGALSPAKSEREPASNKKMNSFLRPPDQITQQEPTENNLTRLEYS